ncbi:P-loop NTPase fold protein (plasmid) [Arsenophonus sp. aPb]|uniref:P-loop NTPase fold protein n=1 Tax=Arsenophonus sp. aPb TaxID=3041619 RepID=UPI0024692DA8|nr:P-loop NTPase fold protein [Arsenophonus sp. aPb]WGL99940.1 P-loop NTPase fold protein [Arsenophonus sp. aPb]
MSLKLQTESPAENDIFRGNSHKKVAEKMAEIVEQQDIDIVGLEGELGSGKSTILKLLKKELDSKFIFIDFDAELYQHGSTKKALIEVIHEGISKQKNVDQTKLDKFKNQALGNIVKYDKKVNSRISWWTITFIIFSFLSLQIFRPLLVDLNNLILKNHASFWIIAIEILCVISPVILLLYLLLPYSRKKNKIPSVGDLFKRNSIDRIEETWLVNKEVGTIELTEALKGFTSKGTILEDIRIILIIDNLDRVSSDKVKELWSDIELIANTTHKHFKIIVPYSAKQVTASLAVDGHNGREFIVKRIPITFITPPLITAGWQEAFQQLWKETVDPSDIYSCKEVSQLLELWKPIEYPYITPRLMKKFVNDIYILNLTITALEKHRYILFALYILVVKYSDHDIKILLRTPKKETEEDKDKLNTKIQLTIKQLSRIFNNDTRRWNEFFMSIHYQTDIELARSELLDNPLVEAINTNNTTQLEELITWWGFSHAWRRIMQKIEIRNALIAISELKENTLDLIKNEIAILVDMFNANFAILTKEPSDRDLNQSLLHLLNSGRIEQEPFLERQKNFIIDELDKLQITDKYDDEVIIELLKDANDYSQIFNKNLLGLIKNKINGEIYANFLFPYEDELSNLNINSLKLTNDNIKKMLLCILNNEEGDLFNPNVIRHIKLSNTIVRDIIDNEEVHNQNNNTLSMLRNDEINNNKFGFRKVILNPEWDKSNHYQYYKNKINAEKQFSTEFAAQAITHMIKVRDFSYLEQYNEYINNKEFIIFMEFYLRYSLSLDNVINELSNDSILPYIENAVCKIINDCNVDNISIIKYVSNYYDLIKQKVPNSKPMTLVKKQEKLLLDQLRSEHIRDLDKVFLTDLLALNELPEINNKLYILAQDIFNNEERLQFALKEINSNRRYILQHMIDIEHFIHMDINTIIFANLFRYGSEETINNIKNIHFLWSCLEDVQRREILDELHDVLLERQTAQNNRINIIHYFHTELTFKEIEKEDHRSIANLFNAALNDETLIDWLDKQKFNFSSWAKEDQETVLHCIINNKNKFPTLCKNSIFIRNRIKNEYAKIAISEEEI